MKPLMVADYMISTDANGPGKRGVIWVQGCDRDCENCCNPDLKDFNGDCTPESPIEYARYVYKDICSELLRGITLTGGEPLHPEHRDAMIFFLEELLYLAPYIDVFVFTGYEGYELDSSFDNIMMDIDMLIAGPYIKELNHPYGLIASTNQEIIRNSSKFDDISDERIINGSRVIEAKIVNQEMIFTGLIGLDDVKKIIGDR